MKGLFGVFTHSSIGPTETQMHSEIFIYFYLLPSDPIWKMIEIKFIKLNELQHIKYTLSLE